MTTLRTSRPSNTIATVYPFGASTPRVFHLVKSWINAHAMLKPPRLLSHLEARVWLQNILPRQCLLTSARYDSYGHAGVIPDGQLRGNSLSLQEAVIHQYLLPPPSWYSIAQQQAT